jgi:hypothetical protein
MFLHVTLTGSYLVLDHLLTEISSYEPFSEENYLGYPRSMICASNGYAVVLLYFKMSKRKISIKVRLLFANLVGKFTTQTHYQ